MKRHHSQHLRRLRRRGLCLCCQDAFHERWLKRRAAKAGDERTAMGYIETSRPAPAEARP